MCTELSFCRSRDNNYGDSTLVDEVDSNYCLTLPPHMYAHKRTTETRGGREW